MRSIDKVKKNKVDRDGKKQGYWEYYWFNGNISEKGSYKDGLEVGIREFYYENGVLRERGLYKDGLPEDIWEYYYEDGSLKCEVLLLNGRFIKEL
jgi:antitoxin component YwqK of YwqJK toxin-antitoxin module